MKLHEARVLLVTEDFPPMTGGVANFLQNICLFSKSDIEVLAASMAGCQEFDRGQPYCVKRVSLRRRLGFVTILFSTLRLVRQRETNVVFWGDFDTSAIAGWLSRLLFGTKLVMLVHGTRLYRSLAEGSLKKWLSLFVLRRCDLIFTNCHYNERRLIELGVPAGKIKMLHPGVDPRLFRPGAKSAEMQRRYDLAGKKVLLTVGRLVKKKNHEMVLRVLPEIRQKVPNVAYVIVGDGPEEGHLQDLARRLDIADCVVFAGSISGETLVEMYNLCDIVLMISRTAPPAGAKSGALTDVETFGIVFSEAGACGRPVIGGNSGGVPDAIVHGETGYLVDPTNEDALKEAVLELLQNPEKARRMGENGRRRVEEELTWDRLVEGFDQNLFQVRNGRPSRDTSILQ